MRNCYARASWCRTELDLALRATGRAPSRMHPRRTPLSQSASALLNVKAFNLSIKVHQNCALPRVDLPSSTWQQLGRLGLGFMLHRRMPGVVTSAGLQKERAHGWRGGPRQSRDERRFAGVLCRTAVPNGRPRRSRGREIMSVRRCERERERKNAKRERGGISRGCLAFRGV